MFKRFNDTDRWKKPWYRKLTPAEKCAWEYITSECDNVGVWEADTDTADFIIGEAIDWQAFGVKCNGNIHIMPNGKWWLVDFCKFQYPKLEEHTTSRPLLSYIALLKNHGLWEAYLKGIHTLSIPLPNPIDTLQDKDKDKEQDKDYNINTASEQNDCHAMPKASTPQSTGAQRIDLARSAWNDRAPGIGPSCRLMAMTFKPEDTTDCLRVMTAYSDAEIIEAMDNYLALRKSSEHEVKPYGSFVGFIRAGVEKFCKDADPWKQFRKAPPSWEKPKPAIEDRAEAWGAEEIRKVQEELANKGELEDIDFEAALRDSPLGKRIANDRA